MTVDRRVLVVADDLIWADRLARAVRTADGEPVNVPTSDRLDAELLDTGRSAGLAIVDLTGRGYDGVDTVQRIAAAGIRVLAVGQHDDHDLRRQALAAGAERVLAYRKLHEDGPATIAGFLAGTWAGAR